MNVDDVEVPYAPIIELRALALDATTALIHQAIVFLSFARNTSLNQSTPTMMSTTEHDIGCHPYDLCWKKGLGFRVSCQ